jgi:hypothetical protein
MECLLYFTRAIRNDWLQGRFEGICCLIPESQTDCGENSKDNP